MTGETIKTPTDAAQAQEDLAFLKSIVSEHTPFARNFGLIYMAGGFLYGLQCAVALLFMKLGPAVPTIAHLINGFLPTALFLIVMTFWIVRDRKRPKATGVVARGIEAAFQGTGLANIVLVAVFGVAAWRASDLSIWLFYPATVCVLQGAVWYGAARLRRRWWMGWVAAGWLIAGLCAGLLINNIAGYVAVLGTALIGLMGVPGWVVLQISKKA